MANETRSGEVRTLGEIEIDGKRRTLHLASQNVVGNGSFGIVFRAEIAEEGRTVAIKKVLQDKRFKNRELEIMMDLNHPNVVKLIHHFMQTEAKNPESNNGEEELYLHLVMEYIPDTVFKVIRHYSKNQSFMNHFEVKLYTYQILRSLGYLHSFGICHRDIKPQNLLVDSSTGVLKLCDFGSAKLLKPDEVSVSYICSRFYRAPELIFGATKYTCAIDVWSTGCVAAEMMLGHPLFPGESGVDQLVEIIKILGTPTKEEIESLNPAYVEFKFPKINSYPWPKIFRNDPSNDFVDFIAQLLQYNPQKRPTALQSLAHPYFDELRAAAMNKNRHEGVPYELPPIFNFTPTELVGLTSAEMDIVWPVSMRPEGTVMPAYYYQGTPEQSKVFCYNRVYHPADTATVTPVQGDSATSGDPKALPGGLVVGNANSVISDPIRLSIPGPGQGGSVAPPNSTIKAPKPLKHHPTQQE